MCQIDSFSSINGNGLLGTKTKIALSNMELHNAFGECIESPLKLRILR